MRSEKLLQLQQEAEEVAPRQQHSRVRFCQLGRYIRQWVVIRDQNYPFGERGIPCPLKVLLDSLGDSIRNLLVVTEFPVPQYNLRRPSSHGEGAYLQRRGDEDRRKLFLHVHVIVLRTFPLLLARAESSLQGPHELLEGLGLQLHFVIKYRNLAENLYPKQKCLKPLLMERIY